MGLDHVPLDDLILSDANQELFSEKLNEHMAKVGSAEDRRRMVTTNPNPDPNPNPEVGSAEDRRRKFTFELKREYECEDDWGGWGKHEEGWSTDEDEARNLDLEMEGWSTDEDEEENSWGVGSLSGLNLSSNLGMRQRKSVGEKGAAMSGHHVLAIGGDGEEPGEKKREKVDIESKTVLNPNPNPNPNWR